MPTVPLLASVADLNASVTSGGASQLVPSGVVMAFAGATAPTGWLVCDGSLINRTTYANLFAAIQTAHGSGDGTTTFALPNYAGRFLRGRANGSANDPDRASRTAAASGGLTGDNVGSVQTNATAKNGLANAASTASGSIASSGGHNHSMRFRTLAGVTIGGDDSRYMLIAADTPGGVATPNQSDGSHTHSFSGTAAAQTITGDAETRPLNAYVNYIIKI